MTWYLVFNAIYCFSAHCSSICFSICSSIRSHNLSLRLNTFPKMSSLYHENCSSISKISIGCKWMYENILRFWSRWLFVYPFSVMQSKCNWRRIKNYPKSRVKMCAQIWKTYRLLTRHLKNIFVIFLFASQILLQKFEPHSLSSIGLNVCCNTIIAIVTGGLCWNQTRIICKIRINKQSKNILKLPTCVFLCLLFIASGKQKNHRTANRTQIAKSKSLSVPYLSYPLQR